jgi:DMSO/TMAO reductase YedYZ molybdopterin-dependent catalytic subunit
MKRKDVRPPKFADQFFKIDFESEPLPILCLYPIPETISLESARLRVAGLDFDSRTVAWEDLRDIPRVRTRQPLICQIFNWSEEVEWEGIRLVDALDHLGLETERDGYYAFYSRDGHYFETLSRDEARDPRVLLAYGLNGHPLPPEHGGPLRLVVPFLQGYKSVKWIKAIRALKSDPLGIKRLRGQSRKARLNDEWRNRHNIHPPGGKTGDPDD